MEYNKIVSALRELARDLLRLKMINDYRSGRFEVEARKKEYEKDLAIAEYNLGKLDTDHPNYDEMKKNTDNQIKKLSERVDFEVKELQNIDEAIAEIEIGKKKVSIDELNCEAEKLIGNYITQKARELE